MRSIRTRKHTAALGVVTAVLALALTACNEEDGTDAAGAAGNTSSSASSTEATQAGGDAKGTDTSKSGGNAQNAGAKTGSSTGGGSKDSGSSAAGGSGNTSDSYAYKHPCKAGDLSIRVYPREGSKTQHVIEVNNTGANSCGLSYFPQVSLGASKASDHSGDIIPAVPGGLGGAPAYPVKPKTAAIAVIDLNPKGGNGLTWINEMNVLADGDHMPNADTQNFELGPDVKVLDPKLGLYEASVADAVKSMESAGK